MGEKMWKDVDFACKPLIDVIHWALIAKDLLNTYI